jgi:dolichyl-phosphate beta-glucosyltransferase
MSKMSLDCATVTVEQSHHLSGGVTINETELDLSLIIPMYNEEKRIRSTLTQVLTWLTEQPLSWEMILVDDGSRDSTVNIVEQVTITHQQIHLIRNPHSGKAYTIRTGILKARGHYVLHADADLSTPPREFSKLITALQEGYDLAIGSRSARRNAPWYRQVMSIGFPLLVRAVAVRGLHDTQCGFKAYRTEVARDLFTRARLYSSPSESLQRARVTAGSDVEILFLAQKLGYRVKEVPVVWTYAEHTKVNPIRDSVQAVLDIFRIRWYEFTGIYRRL